MRRNKAPLDPRGGHVRVHWEMMDSVAWQSLSLAERGLYLAIRRQLKGSNNGNIEATLGTLKHAGIKSSATLAKGLRALIVTGFIAKTRQGGVAYGQRMCSLYRFTDEAVFDFPKLSIQAQKATNDWAKFEKLAAVRAALRDAHALAKRAPKESESGLQKMNRVDSKIERSAAFYASSSEAEAAALAQNLKQQSSPQTTLEAA